MLFSLRQVRHQRHAQPRGSPALNLSPAVNKHKGRNLNDLTHTHTRCVAVSLCHATMPPSIIDHRAAGGDKAAEKELFVPPVVSAESQELG